MLPTTGFPAYLLSLPPSLHYLFERERGAWDEGCSEWRSLFHFTFLTLSSRVDFWTTGGRIGKLFKLLSKSKSYQDVIKLRHKEITPVHPTGSQPWIFIGRTVAETEAPILWSPDAKSRLLRKAPDARKYWRQEKGTTEDEMVGWHHQLNGQEFERALGDGEGQGSLARCSPWGWKELDVTGRLNSNNSRDATSSRVTQHLVWEPESPNFQLQALSARYFQAYHCLSWVEPTRPMLHVPNKYKKFSKIF